MKCRHCGTDIPYNPDKPGHHVRYVKNQHGVFHEHCWPWHKREMAARGPVNQ